jgi:hypothetical protein
MGWSYSGIRPLPLCTRQIDLRGGDFFTGVADFDFLAQVGRWRRGILVVGHLLSANSGLSAGQVLRPGQVDRGGSLPAGVVSLGSRRLVQVVANIRLAAGHTIFPG